MPIRFRCSMCSGTLSIARRKAGTEVECPKCGYEIMVPEEDSEPEPKPAAAAPLRTKQQAPDRPLFEHSDFDRLLDSKVKQAAGIRPDPAPATQPTPVEELPFADDGLHLSRSTLVILGVAAVILVLLAFGIGFLVGS